MIDEIIIDVSKYMAWYFLLIFGIMVLSFVAALKNRDWFPIIWGIALSLVIYWFRNQIAPLVFGVMNYEWAINPVMYILTGWFAVVFFTYIAVTLWNTYTRNEVVS